MRIFSDWWEMEGRIRRAKLLAFVFPFVALTILITFLVEKRSHPALDVSLNVLIQTWFEVAFVILVAGLLALALLRQRNHPRSQVYCPPQELGNALVGEASLPSRPRKTPP
jgi:protein-S-isoprenylcysteine O-methyltransferase Ste14